MEKRDIFSMLTLYIVDVLQFRCWPRIPNWLWNEKETSH